MFSALIHSSVTVQHRATCSLPLVKEKQTSLCLAVQCALCYVRNVDQERAGIKHTEWAAKQPCVEMEVAAVMLFWGQMRQ